MKIFKQLLLVMGILLSTSQIASAQTTANETNLIDSFYSSGKIMVVIAGLGLVLAILVFYLVRLERKLNKIEKNK
jgi:uncharacterized membrane protein